MACPLIAAIALLWREAMQLKGIMPTGSNVLCEFRKWLYRIAKDTNKNGWDATIGYGVLLLNPQDL
jgi:ABC-type tungstate transport system substrate-binding protein